MATIGPQLTSSESTPLPEQRTARFWFALFLKSLGLIVAVGFSLLAYPAIFPWVVGAWLLVAVRRMSHGKPPWGPLGFVLFLVFVRQVPWLPGVLALVAGVIVAGGIYGASSRRLRPPDWRLFVATNLVLFVAWSVLLWNWWESERSHRHPQFASTKPVVCFGDSLSSGDTSAGGYAPVLGRRLVLPVIDFSEPGVTSDYAFKTLEKLEKLQPQIVVVELGGHDYLRGRTRSDTKANLLRIIRAARNAGAEVILMEIPRDVILDPFWGLERELAWEHDLELIPDSTVRDLFYWSPCALGAFSKTNSLSDDCLHPNPQGDRHLADAVAMAIIRILGPRVMAR